MCVVESWIHCNDARMERCSLSDVMSAQAYILFYTQLPVGQSVTQGAPSQTENLATNQLFPAGSSTNSKNSNSQTSSRKQPEILTEKADDEITFNFRNSLVPQFRKVSRNSRKRNSETGNARKPPMKRRKTTVW